MKHTCHLDVELDIFYLAIKRSWRRFFIADPECAYTQDILRSQFMIKSERIRHFLSYEYTISPLSRFRRYWEILMISTFLLFFIFQPVHVAFVYGTFKDSNFRHWMRYFGTFMDVIFFLDIGLNFFTGFRRSKNEEIELDLKKIGTKYVKGYFLIDFLSSIPFYSVIPIRKFFTFYDCIIHSVYYNSCLADVLDVLKMLKLFRFPTFIFYINNLFKRLRWRHFHFKITRVRSQLL